MERIYDKLISIGIAHLTSTKQCDIRSFLLPSVSPFIDLNEALEWKYYNFYYLILYKGLFLFQLQY
jgi:hypothetical protein